jgi:signal transduction histidine kinase
VLLEPFTAAKGLALEVDLPAEPAVVETDVTKVRQILLNLLTNAGKFTDRGTVGCRMRATAEVVVIEVSDTGRGIADDDLPRLFDVFWQGGASERKRPEGVGLGLSVSQRLARLLGGEITVASAAGQGSTFTLQLPRRAPNDDGGGTDQPAEGTAS